MTTLTTNEIIGKNIRFLRHQSELTLTQLADELNINPRHLGNIETGKRSVNIILLDKLCQFFNKSHVYFFIPNLSNNNFDENTLQSAIELVKSSNSKTQKKIIKMINILTGND